MSWQFTLEFSGITLIHVFKDGGADYRGVALFSPGLSDKHTPFLYVPMEGLRNPASFATPEAIAAFGLRTIPAPGGHYLLEVALNGASVDMGPQGVVPRGPVVFTKTADPGRPSALPPDWHDLMNSVDLKALAQKYDARRSVDPGRARGTVWLPGGRLVGIPFLREGDRDRTYDLSVQEGAGAKTTVSHQFVADRQALVAQASQPQVLIKVVKGAERLDLPFGPNEGERAMSVVFSSNCVAGTGAPEELSEYVPLLTPGNLSLWMDKMLATDDHPCVTAIWVEQ